MPTLIVLISLFSSDATVQERMVDAAREVVGVPYEFGGRMRRPGEGIDCQGVLFYAAEAVGECGWKSYDTKPTRSVKHGELGRPVPGLDPIASTELDLADLRPGDVILLVEATENPKEPAIAELHGEPVWVWHTGLYGGNGTWLVGDHIAGEAVETDLLRYLRDNADAYTGLFVTRLTGTPRPQRCRHHPAMGLFRSALPARKPALLPR